MTAKSALVRPAPTCPSPLLRHLIESKNSASFHCFFSAFRLLHHCAALKIERKMSHLNISFDRFPSVGTVMHYILVISKPSINLFSLDKTYKHISITYV